MYSAKEALELANRLVKHLKSNIYNTYGQKDWTQRNLTLLREFAHTLEADSFPSAPDASPEQKAQQFLWDFIAYQRNTGVVLAAESEHDKSEQAILDDFEKLLYVRSPVKLMICRINDRLNAEQQAIQIRNSAREFMKDTCTCYTPGEVFVLYCVWWSGQGGENRDFAFRLQVMGELDYTPIGSEEFEPI